MTTPAKSTWLTFGLGLLLGYGIPALLVYWWYGSDILLPLLFGAFTMAVVFLIGGLILFVTDER